MRTIHSFINLCEEINEDLSICWKNNPELTADFEDLFLPLHHSKVKISFINSGQNDLKFSDRQMNFSRQRIYNSMIKWYQRLYFDKVYHTFDVVNLINSGYDFTRLKRHKRPYIATWSRIRNVKIDSQLFVPASSILEEIKSYTSTFNQFTIGVHIRRADHVVAINTSPLELFIQKMEEQVKNNSETNFFLASDSSAVKAELKTLFGSKLTMQHEQDADRGSKGGMIQAVIDLYALAATQKILGSHASSFSEIAAELNNIPFEEVKL